MKKENEIIVEILKKCNWWERIIVKRNKKLLTKVYNIIRLKIVNNIL